MKQKVSHFTIDCIISLILIGLGVSPSHILAFVTGSWEIPPMGFPLRPTITFISDETSIFPTASTCSLTLRIKTYDSESRGQEEVGHTQRTSELFTRSTALKFVIALNKPP